MLSIPSEHRTAAGARVLLLSDPDDLPLAEISMVYANSLEAEGAFALGTRLSDTEGLALLSNARYAMATAGPSRQVQRRSLQNLIRETEALDGIHWLQRDGHGGTTVLLLNGDLEFSAPLSVLPEGSTAAPNVRPGVDPDVDQRP